MKIKGILLIIVILVVIPEILFVSYVFSKYSIEINFSPNYTSDFFTFLLSNPIFFIVILVVIIMMLILYFALQTK